MLVFSPPSDAVTSTTRILSKSKTRDVEGLVHGLLPNGSVLVDRYVGGDIDKPSYPVLVDPATGRETSGRKAYNADSGVVGFGRDSLLVVTDDGKKHALREFGLDFAKIREVALPGRSGVGGPDVGQYAVYGDAVGGDDAVFIAKSEWKGVESVADSVTRVGKDGKLTTLLKNKHVDQIVLASDGRTLLASMAEEGPYYEGGAPLADIVELDARTGTVVRTYGIPKPCTTFEPLFDDASCLDRLDKVGGVGGRDDLRVGEARRRPRRLLHVAVRGRRLGRGQEPAQQAGRSGSRHSTRLQHQVEPPAPRRRLLTRRTRIEWVVGDKVSKIPGTSKLGAFDWFAPGSLVQP